MSPRKPVSPRLSPGCQDQMQVPHAGAHASPAAGSRKRSRSDVLVALREVQLWAKDVHSASINSISHMTEMKPADANMEWHTCFATVTSTMASPRGQGREREGGAVVGEGYTQ